MSNGELGKLEASLSDTTTDAVFQGFSSLMGGAAGLAKELHTIYQGADAKTKLRILDMMLKVQAKVDAGKIKASAQPQALQLADALQVVIGRDSPLGPMLERAVLSLGGS